VGRKVYRANSTARYSGLGSQRSEFVEHEQSAWDECVWMGEGMTAPLVSVILSVRNGAADLPGAIDSILRQTFTNFEFIILNNASSDGTAAILDKLSDSRVRVVHQDNLGLGGSLNRGISIARGRYVARQDHDDWAAPTRLEKQVSFLEKNPDCALIGTRAEIWVGDKRTDRVHDHPTEDAALRFELLFDNPFVHSSVMLRKAALEQVGGYATDPTRAPPEDYELWSRIARKYRVANLPERLMVYREMEKSMSRDGINPFLARLVLISSENLAAAVGEKAPCDCHRDIAALTHGAYGSISARPDIETMCALIQKAGQAIHSTAPRSDIPDRVELRIRNLRYGYGLYQQYNALPAWLQRHTQELRPLVSFIWRYSGLRWAMHGFRSPKT